MQPAIQAVFTIPPQTHLLDFTGAAHVFYEAGCYGAPVKLIFSSIFTGQTTSTASCPLAFHQLVPFDELQLNAGDLVFIPGIEFALLYDQSFLQNSLPFQHWLQQQHQKGVIISSVCTGAFLLGEAGLLNGRACTTHWKYIDRFKQRFPQAVVQTNRLFIQEGNLYTSAGVSSGIDLALYITEQLWGSNFAARVAKEIVIYFRRTAGDPQLSVFTMYRNHLDDRIHIVQDVISQALQHKLNIEELSEKVSMSARNLTRLFKKTTNITIGAYTQKLRMERAGQLINEGHTLQAAALHCGLKSPSQLRHLLKQG